jgi:alkylated DNA repair dioxygenase AlkB
VDVFALSAPSEVPLDPEHAVQARSLPPELLPDPPAFEALWALHPAEFNSIHMAGRPVRLPRWQRAYGEDYRFSGSVSEAAPMDPLLAPYLAWARQAIDGRLTGLLVNWYDAERAHHIGKHRDSPIGLVPGAPIVTISLGASRLFRLRPYGREGERVDVPVDHGTVLVLPWAVNQRFTHEVPYRPSKDSGRRISVTIRAFDGTPGKLPRRPR